MRRILLWAIALIVLSAGTVRAQKMMDDAQIRELLVGRSALFSDYSIATYGTDGSYTYVAANNLYFKGTYTISGGKVCLTIERGQNRCDGVGADAYGPYLLTSKEDKLRFAVRSAAPPQNVAMICGVQVAYTIQPPAARVPPEVAAFSGIWVGKWDYGMCGALIVESVQPNGLATVIYVNGDYGLEKSFKSGSVRFPAMIDDNKLSDGGRTTDFEAVMKGNNELAVRRTGGPGAGTAMFSRR